MTQLETRKILHVMIDEKFNDMAIRQFEEAEPGVSEYWVIATQLILTRSALARKCTITELQSQLSRSNISGVVFHSLLPSHYKLLRKIPNGKCVIWLGWGYDYYPLLSDDCNGTRILNKTEPLHAPPIKRQLKRLVEPVLHRLILLKNGGLISDLARIDYFAPVLDLEYEMVLRQVSLKAEYIEWNYGTAEDDFSQADMGLAVGKNILAGNSATATNNHIELFEAIRDRIDLKDRKVIVPLSYGDAYYRSRVMKEGERLLGNAFTPLTTFMKKDQYLEIIRSCGFVMMNHLRQQALGNIFIAMLMGAKIFLNEENPLTAWLRFRGASIGSIDNIDLHLLQDAEKEANRLLVYSHLGREHQKRKTKNLIEIARSQNMRHK